MPTIITASTNLIAASGIEVSKSQVQAGGVAGESTRMVQIGGFTKGTTVDQFQGFDQTEKIRGFQGAGNSGNIIVAKLDGSADDEGLVYSNVIQNPSFEGGISRWYQAGTSQHGAAVVSQFPQGRGFDNGNAAALDVPQGQRMLHMIKAGETGSLAIVQDVFEDSNTALLGNFSFSVAPDSAFTSLGNPAGRFGMVALQFISGNTTQHTIAYYMGGIPQTFPPGFPSRDQNIQLTHPGADQFQRFTRDLGADISGSFSFTAIRIWIVTDMEDTLFTQEFDTLWDWFVLETGQLQPELFQTSSEEKLIITSTDEVVDYRNFVGVLGTKSTIEKDFDRSPFFFTPSEIDPNTERDLAEVEPFLLFSQAFLRTYEALRALPSETIVISAKGEEFSSDQLADENVVINGSFETGNTAFWDTDVGTGGSIQVREDSLNEGGIPGGLLPPDGRYWIYIVKANQNFDSAYFKQTIRFGRDYSSRAVKRISWSAVFDYTGGSERRNQLSLVFYNNGNPTYHLRYYFGSQGFPNLPDEFPDSTPNVNRQLPATEDVINSYLREFLVDSSQAVFDFDRLDVWWVTDSSDSNDTNTYVDDLSVTMSIPSTELLKTTDLAHVMTNTPVSSGTELPFTISGSDDVSQIDQTPPFFDETAPASGTSFNPTAGILRFHVKDAHSDLDTTNIDVWVDGVQVVNASTVETSATWPTGNRTVISARDIRYDFIRVTDYPQQSTVTVSGELTDLADPVSNQAITEYNFTVLGSGTLDATISGSPDGTPPSIILDYPDDLDTQVSPNTKLSWSVTDDASGVDPSTLKLYINGALKIDEDVAVVGSFSRVANTQRGFDYIYTPDGGFTFGQTVTGTIEVEDYVGNFASKSYEFTITPDDTLVITNFSIGAGQSVLVESGTDISVCVEDFTHGVNVSGSFVTANGVVPSGLTIATSGAGPDKVIYTFPAAGNIGPRTDVDVYVYAENNFPGPFPVIKEENFNLRPGYDVEWWNRSTGIGSGAETVFPYTTNVQVLAEVLNFGKNFNQGSLFYRFLTEHQNSSDLGASLVSNIQTADLPAYLNSLNTIFEYGKTIVLEVEVADNEGNQLSFTHTFTIEDKPN